MLAVIPFFLATSSLASARPLNRRDPALVPSYNSWTSLGCYVDSPTDRTLPVGMQTDGGNAGFTVEKCLDACQANGYGYGGVEYGVECYCSRDAPQQVATDGRCNMACGGDSSELCGGSDGINVYQNGNPPANPTVLPSYKDWTSAGCYADWISNRVLPNQIFLDHSEVTVESCLDACSDAGFQIAGLEYGQECWCGASMPTEEASSDNCSYACHGNPLEYCGGQDYLNVYTTTPSTTTTGPTETGPTGPTETPPPTCQTTYVAPYLMTCDDVAAKFGITAKDVKSANEFVDCSAIWQWTPLCIPTVVTPPSNPTCTQTYTSCAGDTCDSLGVKFGVRGVDILNANSFLDCGNIWPGTPICVPPTNCVETYTSCNGDTCDSIGAHFGIPGSVIKGANNFLNCQDIWDKTPICIPAYTSSPPVSVA